MSRQNLDGKKITFRLLIFHVVLGRKGDVIQVQRASYMIPLRLGAHLRGIATYSCYGGEVKATSDSSLFVTEPSAEFADESRRERRPLKEIDA